MASPLVKAREFGTKDLESNNGWTVKFTESDSAVEKQAGEADRELLTVTKVTRRRKRNSPFTPEEFWQYVDRRGPDECWPWLGTVLAYNGYGFFWHPILKRTLPAHRVAWLVTHGTIPNGLHVLHNCSPSGDNPLCCNVTAHLWLGTHLDNMQDMAAKGRRSPDAHGPKKSLRIILPSSGLGPNPNLGDGFLADVDQVCRVR